MLGGLSASLCGSASVYFNHLKCILKLTKVTDKNIQLNLVIANCLKNLFVRTNSSLKPVKIDDFIKNFDNPSDDFNCSS